MHPSSLLMEITDAVAVAFKDVHDEELFGDRLKVGEFLDEIGK